MKASFLITLYYSLASIIGLVLCVVGASMLINLLLRTYILQIPKYPSMPPRPYENIDPQVKQLTMDPENKLSEEDKKALEQWKVSYERWERDQEAYDQADVDIKNQLATSISMLVVGMPVLYLHQRELKKK